MNNYLKAIFNLESLGKEAIMELRNLIDSINKHLRSLKSLGLPVDNWDAMLVYLVSTKLDKSTARAWEQHYDEKALPSLQTFLKFLKGADFLETLEVKQQPNNKSDKKPTWLNNSSHKHSNKYSLFSGLPEVTCLMCKESHLLHQCKLFLALTVPERWEKVKHFKVCSNCFRKGPFSRQCRCYACKHCKFKHNYLLHSTANAVENTETQPNAHSEATVSFSSQMAQCHVLLATAEVLVEDRHKKLRKARMVLDSGSQSSFISLEIAKELNLNVNSVNASIVGITNNVSHIDSECSVVLKSRIVSDFQLNIHCLVLPKIGECTYFFHGFSKVQHT